MSTSSTFWDNISEKYSKKAVPSEKIYQEKLTRTQKLFNKAALVMEFGCGTGTTSLIHSPFVKQIDAYDFSEKMIGIANEKKWDQSIKNVDFNIESVETIDYKENYYDVIMGHSILHLTKDNEVILKKVYSSLKPGGYFVSSSGCMKDMNFLIQLILPLITKMGKAPYVNQFSAEELVQLHKDTGFKIIDDWRYKKGELFLIARK